MTQDNSCHTSLEGTGISSSTLVLADKAPAQVSQRAVELLAASRAGSTSHELARILEAARAAEADLFALYKRYRKYAEKAYDGIDLWEIGKAQELLEVLIAGHNGREVFFQMLTPPEDREGWVLDGQAFASTTIH